MVFGVVLVWFCYGFGGFGSGFGMSLVGFGMLLVWFWYVSACMLLTACCLKQHLCSKPLGFPRFLLGATAVLQIAGDSGPAVGGRRAVGDSAEGYLQGSRMAGGADADLGGSWVTGRATRIPPGGEDPDAEFRILVARSIYWHPPLVLPDHDKLRAPGVAFTQRMQHPRAEIIAANPSVRLMYTCQIWDVTAGVDGARLPPCDWCGIPTGCWCSGIAPTDKRPGFECRTAVCTICAKFLDLCVACTAWSGIPLELDKRINLRGISVRPHEALGPAVTAALLQAAVHGSGRPSQGVPDPMGSAAVHRRNRASSSSSGSS